MTYTEESRGNSRLTYTEERRCNSRLTYTEDSRCNSKLLTQKRVDVLVSYLHRRE